MHLWTMHKSCARLRKHTIGRGISRRPSGLVRHLDRTSPCADTTSSPILAFFRPEAKREAFMRLKARPMASAMAHPHPSAPLSGHSIEHNGRDLAPVRGPLRQQ